MRTSKDIDCLYDVLLEKGIITEDELFDWGLKNG